MLKLSFGKKLKYVWVYKHPKHGRTVRAYVIADSEKEALRMAPEYLRNHRRYGLQRVEEI